MTLRPLKSLKWSAALLALSLSVVRAAALDITRSADDYFHGGAMHYLSNNVPAALNVVTNGLQQYPGDEKLQKLEALLKQQQQQQQQDKDQQDQQKQQEKDQQSQQDKQQSNQDRPDKSEQQQKEDQPPQQNAGQPEQQKDQNAKAQPAGAEEQPQEMTPEQALRVLDSTKGDEQVLPLQPMQPPPQSNQKLKDW
jgi:Ca-activated chloride channel family protein